MKQKNIKHVRYFPHGLARQISHQNFAARVRKRLNKLQSRSLVRAVYQSTLLGKSRGTFLACHASYDAGSNHGATEPDVTVESWTLFIKRLIMSMRFLCFFFFFFIKFV